MKIAAAPPKGSACVRCGMEPGTVEARIYSKRKVSQLRGCACGNAAMNRYATGSAYLCPACATRVAALSRRRRTIARVLSPVFGVAAGFAYYFAVEAAPYPAVVTGLLVGAAFIPFWLANERRESSAFIGWLAYNRADGSYAPRFRPVKRAP